MKKLSFFLLALPLFLNSCKSDDVTPQSLEGTWKLISLDFKVKSLEEGEQSEMVDYSGLNSTFTFKADGTYSATLQGEDDLVSEYGLASSGAGTYTIKDGKVTLTSTEDDITYDTYFKLDLNGNKAVLSMDKALYLETFKSQLLASGEDTLDFFGFTIDELIALFNEEIEEFDAKLTLEKQ